jgi:hypothetical protein
MFDTQTRKAGFRPALLIALLCIAATLFGSVTVSGSSSPAASVESLLVGGSSECGDFMNGFAVGMGIGALFGCVWCIAGGVVAKGIAMFC